MVVTDGCPVRFLREIREDGSELFIGDVGIIRGNHGEVVGLDGLDWDNKAKYEAENKALPVGDARIVWSIGGKETPVGRRQMLRVDDRLSNW